jgi:hypothetical protein
MNSLSVNVLKLSHKIQIKQQQSPKVKSSSLKVKSSSLKVKSSSLKVKSSLLKVKSSSLKVKSSSLQVKKEVIGEDEDLDDERKQTVKKQKQKDYDSRLHLLVDLMDQCLLAKWKSVHPFDPPPHDLLVWKSIDRS